MAAKKTSAGLLMFRQVAGRLELFLAHPGGPFYRHKDEGAWTIPKGEVEAGDPMFETALREFQEETGIIPGRDGHYIPLGKVKQRSGKVVHAWAFEGNIDDDRPIVSNTFSLEWPPKSGKTMEFPEIDRAQFFDVATARRKMIPAQLPFIEELLQRLLPY